MLYSWLDNKIRNLWHQRQRLSWTRNTILQQTNSCAVATPGDGQSPSQPQFSSISIIRPDSWLNLNKKSRPTLTLSQQLLISVVWFVYHSIFISSRDSEHGNCRHVQLQTNGDRPHLVCRRIGACGHSVVGWLGTSTVFHFIVQSTTIRKHWYPPNMDYVSTVHQVSSVRPLQSTNRVVQWQTNRRPHRSFFSS